MPALQNVSSTLATIAEAMVKINTTNNTNTTTTATDDVKPIYEMDMFYEISFFVHLLGALYVLFKTLSQKKCEGFSLKTQTLITVSSLLRFVVAKEATATVLYIPKVVQLFIDVAAFVAVYIYQSRKDSKLDPCRVELIIIGCFFMGQLKLDAAYNDWLLTVCLLLDTVALLPQFILVEKTMYLSKMVLWFVHCYLMSQVAYGFHLYRIYCYGYGIPKYETLCRDMLSKLCILVMGMLIFMNYMKTMLKGYESQLRARLDLFEANKGHDADCPQKQFPAQLAVTTDFYHLNKQLEKLADEE